MSKPKDMSEEEWRKLHSERERKRYHANKARKQEEYASLSDEEKEVIREKRRIASKKWRDENPERAKYHDNKKRATPEYKEKRREYLNRPDVRSKNQERMKIYNQEYGEKNKEQTNEYHRNRYQTDIDYRLKHLLRCRLRDALKGNRKPDSAIKLVGCTVGELKAHIESTFAEWMSWSNFGEWQIDHKIPISSFDLSDENQVRIAFHFTNLQALCRYENARKGSKLDYESST